ncbi:hypothetical protein CALCODRAFT_480054 [Calocera cornea HHB12733]|uniref:Copper homeostasis protein cutC homolog n=1 Tax=Calocera cornea HHB12733 TaxID=1353952 RepID=A0A165J3W8_9BASI|nr:hypothetical protein CALCODRAFT_480054 [Calocera cornea HHB12733]
MASAAGDRRVLIEVCVDSLESAIIAQENGADRLEVCTNLAVGGGTTPSIGLISCILEQVQLPVMVLIRCRTGDFFYGSDELEVMTADIGAIAQLSEMHKGHEVGVVIGALCRDGTIDEPAVKALMLATGHMPVTFHRAFDMVQNPDEGESSSSARVGAHGSSCETALLKVSGIGGIRRILTR